jgi:hypothetical protein
MPRLRRLTPRRTACLAAVLGILAAAAPTAASAPTVTRTHLEYTLPVDDCGITTLDFTVNLVYVDGLTGPRSLTVSVRSGTAVDEATGQTYRVVDAFTQVLRSGYMYVETAQGTLIFVNATGGLVARGVVHITILPDGTLASDAALHFVRCL